MQQFEDKNGLGKGTELLSKQLKRERYQEIVKDSIAELYSNAAYWDFFKSFNEESVHDFIIEYASKKAWYLVNGERILANHEHELFRYRDIAESCFWEIQQKKLFNMQAEWRAGLIEIEGVETTKDFLCWEKSISSCPFIEPVSKADFDLYCEYVSSGNYKEKLWLYNWQDYEVYRNNSIESGQQPAWYQFYDLKRGTGYLQLLPDKKGAEEKKYYDAWQQKQITMGVLQVSDEDMIGGPLPNLHMTYETLDFFIKTFENKMLLTFFQAEENRPEDATKDEELEQALRILRKAPAGIQLPKAGDWREAVIAGANEYKHNEILANLPAVYDNYLFRLRSGIAFNESCSDGLMDEFLSNARIYLDCVNEGKAWLTKQG